VNVLRAKFDGKIVTEEELDKEIELLKNLTASLIEETRQSTVVQPGLSEQDKYVLAMEGMLTR